MANRVAEQGLDAVPVSLTAEELDAERYPVTQAQGPVWVRAWARFPERSVRVQARAVAWTARAVQLEWESAGGVMRRAWVWASAVDRLDGSR